MFLKKIFKKNDGEKKAGRTNTVMGIQRESNEKYPVQKTESHKSRSESTITRNEITSPSIQIIPEKKDRMARIRQSIALTFGGKKENKKKTSGSVLGALSEFTTNSSPLISPLISPKSTDVELVEEDFQFTGMLANLQTMSKQIESFTDGNSSDSYESFLKRKQYRLQTFDATQKLNLANKVNVDLNDGYLYSEGLVFHSYLPTGSKYLFELFINSFLRTFLEVIKRRK